MNRCNLDDATLVAYVWDELDELSKSEVSAHLDSCQRCRGRASRLSRARRGLRELAEEQVPEAPSLWEKVERSLPRRRRHLSVWAWPAAAALLVGLTFLLKRPAQKPVAPGPGPEAFAVLEARVGEREAQVFVFSPNDSVVTIWLQ